MRKRHHIKQDLALYYKDHLQSLNLAYRDGQSTPEILEQFNNAYLQIAHTHRWAKDNRKTNKSAAMLCIAFPAFGVRLLSMRQSIEEQIEWASVALAVAKSNKHLEAQGYMLGRL